MNWPSYRQIAAFWFQTAHLFTRVGVAVAGVALVYWVWELATSTQIDRMAALMTPLIAVFGVYIAFQQWHTARSKLKLDLFERRYAVYQAAVDVMSKTDALGVLSKEEVDRFQVAIRGARFIFDDSVGAYLDETHDRIRQILFITENIKSQTTASASRSEATAKRNEHRTWVASQWTEKMLDARLGEYLRLQG